MTEDTLLLLVTMQRIELWYTVRKTVFLPLEYIAMRLPRYCVCLFTRAYNHLVLMVGLEPTRPKSTDFKSAASADFATSAYYNVYRLFISLHLLQLL